jgi:hypothetical protein
MVLLYSLAAMQAFITSCVARLQVSHCYATEFSLVSKPITPSISHKHAHGCILGASVPQEKNGEVVAKRRLPLNVTAAATARVLYALHTYLSNIVLYGGPAAGKKLK